MILASSVILSCCQTCGFLKEFFFQKNCSWSYSLPCVSQSRSQLLTSIYPYFTSPALMVYVKFQWMRQNVICLAQIYCKIKDWIHKFILIFMTDQVSAQINTCSFSCLTLFAGSCFSGMPSFLSLFFGSCFFGMPSFLLSLSFLILLADSI